MMLMLYKLNVDYHLTMYTKATLIFKELKIQLMIVSVKILIVIQMQIFNQA